jgi:cytochrome c553
LQTDDEMRWIAIPVGTLVAAAIFAPAHAADAAAGRQKAAKCRTCHGLDGIAKIPTAPHIAGESQIYLQTQLKAFRSGKREHEIMSVIAKDMSDADIADLAAWYSSIQITVQMPE